MNLLKNRTNSIIALFASASLIYSCGGSTNNEKDAAKEAAFEKAEQKLSKDLKQVLTDLPAPTEVPYMLQASGSDFNASFINGLDKLSNYETNSDESALNLGVYATDMGYLLSYNKTSDSRKYMEANQKLAEALGVATVFDVKTIEDFQSNMDNADELNKILIKAIADAEVKLQESDRVNVAALVLTGSFVEGLYLAVKTIEEYPKDIVDADTRNLLLERLVRVVLEQKKPLNDIIGMLKDLDHDKIIATMITELNILKGLYDGDLAEIEKKISENTGNFVLTDDMISDITREIKRIRKDIVDFQ